MSWKEFFKVVKVVPGRVVTPRYGLIDLSSDAIPLERIQDLYENDFPYLEITPKGRKELYGQTPPVKAEPKPVPSMPVAKPKKSPAPKKAPVIKKNPSSSS